MKKYLPFIFTIVILLIYSSSSLFGKKSNVEPPKETSMESNPLIQTSTVTKVFDGDTIEIESGIKVRYIGIDTPEIYPKKECYAEESRAKNTDLVLGKKVKLIKDQSETDKYGRILRYVYIDDLFVNDYLVKNGYAKTLNISPDTKYSTEFTSQESTAKKFNLGLWGKCF